VQFILFQLIPYNTSTTLSGNGVGKAGEDYSYAWEPASMLVDASVQNPVYIPSQYDLDDGVVTLTMTVVPGSGCAAVSDQMILHFSDQAVISAGSDASICETGMYTLSTASRINATSILWTTSGTGTFVESTFINTTYIPGVADISAGSVYLILTANSASPCVTVVDSMLLTISPQATAYAGDDATICEGSAYTLSAATGTNAPEILWTTSGTGTFSNAASLNPVYTPSQNDLDDGSVVLTITVSSVDPCSDATDEMKLTFTKPAVANAGPDATICETGTIELLAATESYAYSMLWTTTGDGTFDHANMLNPVYTPGPADILNSSVKLLLTVQSFSPCAAVVDTMVLHISKQPTAYTGPDAIICEGSTYTLAAAAYTNAPNILWTSTGTGTFSDATLINPVYTPSQNDLDDGSVILTLTSTAIGPCFNAVDQMVLTFNERAVVYAGADATICESQTYSLATATQTWATSMQWTTNGTGTFSNTTILNPVYTPGLADIAAGHVTLVLTAQSASPCTAASDTLVLFISKQATANAGTDYTVCEGSMYTLNTAVVTNAGTILWTTSGTGTFDNPANQNPVYTPSQNDLDDGIVTLTLTVASVNPCAIVSDMMFLTFSKQAIVQTGADATICNGSTYTLSGASHSNATSFLWTSSGNGTFSNTNTLNPVYTPGSADIAGTYVTLVLTGQSASPCIPARDTLLLHIAPQATAFAGSDVTICQTENYALASALTTHAETILWTSSGTGSFSNATVQNPVYTPSQNDLDDGSVVLTLTAVSADPCANAVDYMTLSFNDQATASAGTDAVICGSETYTLASATQTSAISVLWTTSGTGTFNDASLLNPVYTPGAADIASGTVLLTLTAQSAGSCVAVTDEMMLTISKQSSADAGTDFTICEGSTYTLNTATAQYAATMAWTSSGTGSFSNATVLNPTYTPSQNDLDDGSVVLTLTTTSVAPCINATDHMTLTFSKPAVVYAGTDATICETETFTASAATQMYASSMIWTSTGDGTFIDVAPLNPVFTPGSADILAGTVTLTLTAHAAFPCPDVSDALVLNISKQATAYAGIDFTSCDGAVYELSTATVSNASSILWTSSGTGSFSNSSVANPVYTPSQNDLDDGTVTLTLTVTSDGPCTDVTDFMVLNFTPQAQVAAGADATICESETYTLSGATQSFAASVHWSTSGNGIFTDANSLNPNYIPGSNDIASGTVTLTITAQSASPCYPVSDALVIHISKPATAYAGSDATICEGTNHAISGALTTNAVTILWTTSGTGSFSNAGIENPVYTPSQNDLDDGTVTLTLTATSVDPCADATDFMVLNFNKQAVVDAGIDATICETSTHMLSSASQSNATSLLWMTNGDGTFSSTTDLNPVYTPGSMDIFTGYAILTLVAQSANSCVEAIDNMVLYLTPQATANAGVDATICEGSTYYLNTSEAHNASSVLWTTIGTGTSSSVVSLHPIYTPSQNDIDDGIVTLTLTIGSDAPCVNATDYMVLHISTPATVTAGEDAIICETETYALSGAAHTNATAILWTTTGTGTFSNPVIPNPVYHPSAADIPSGMVILTFTPQSSGTWNPSVV